MAARQPILVARAVVPDTKFAALDWVICPHLWLLPCQRGVLSITLVPILRLGLCLSRAAVVLD